MIPRLYGLRDQRHFLAGGLKRTKSLSGDDYDSGVVRGWLFPLDL